MNVLAVNFSPSILERQTFLDFLNTRREIINWLAVNESMVLIVATITHHELREIIHITFPAITFFVFNVKSIDIDGMQTANIWEFINHPRSSGYWENMPQNQNS